MKNTIILKYSIQVRNKPTAVTLYRRPRHGERVIVKLPKDGRLLTVQDQCGVLMAWVMGDVSAPLVDAVFTVLWTGCENDQPEIAGEYVTTIQTHDGALVEHIFVDRYRTF